MSDNEEIRCPDCSLPLYVQQCNQHCRHCTWILCPGCNHYIDSRKATPYNPPGLDPL